MCAIFGIIGHEEAANFTYLGLHALQHRGQEGAGIITTNEQRKPRVIRGQGLVGDVFSSEKLAELKGFSAVGHTRYSTSGENNPANLQPLLMKSHMGWLAVAHNGNLVNAKELIKKLEKEGSLFQSTTDTEVILHLIARNKNGNLSHAIIEALKQVEGAYSLLFLTPDFLIAVRDPYGFRPLVMGNVNGAKVFSGETCAFELMGAEFEREIAPGEMVIVSRKEPGKIESLFPFEKKPQKKCVFEYVYFARPDTSLFGAQVYEVRKSLGKRLAEEHPVPHADVVIPVPDSGVPAAIGFSEGSKIPFDMGILRSHYIGRTFIEPKQSIRDFGVKLKLSPISKCVKDKVVVVIDDSLVRGTTSKKLIRLLREAGAKEVHIRISAPPTTHSCFYGIDTPTREELLASSKNNKEICEFIGADSLGYLSLDGLLKAGESVTQKGFCHACFSGEYPTAI